MLLALSLSKHGIAAQILRSLNFHGDGAAQKIVAGIHASQPAVMQGSKTGYSRSFKILVALASRQAKRRRDDYVGTQHVLFALTERDDLCQEFLRSHGIEAGSLLSTFEALAKERELADMPAEPRILPMTDNLRVAMWRAEDNPRAVLLYFQAREHKEPVSFHVTTSATILSSFWQMPSLRGGYWLTHTESRSPHHYAIALGDHQVLDQPFIVGLELDTAGDPQDCVTGATIWDRADGESQVAYIEFPTVA